jgi:hypothetical protein
MIVYQKQLSDTIRTPCRGIKWLGFRVQGLVILELAGRCPQRPMHRYSDAEIRRRGDAVMRIGETACRRVGVSSG